MPRFGTVFVCCTAALSLAGGCSSQTTPKREQLSGKVLFNGKPVPAGSIAFVPDSGKGNQGAATVAQIKDGMFDTAKEANSGFQPGPNLVTISGFDGKPLSQFPQGKQIFNPYQKSLVLEEGKKKMDFNVPASAAEDLKIVPTTGTE